MNPAWGHVIGLCLVASAVGTGLGLGALIARRLYGPDWWRKK